MISALATSGAGRLMSSVQSAPAVIATAIAVSASPALYGRCACAMGPRWELIDSAMFRFEATSAVIRAPAFEQTVTGLAVSMMVLVVFAWKVIVFCLRFWCKQLEL